MFNKFFKVATLTFFIILQSHAQDISTASGYMNTISTDHRQIAQDIFSYVSAIAHGKGARKVENRRKTMIQTLNGAIKKVNALPPFKGDRSLKDSALQYLKTSLLVLNNDYEKIVNMEEIAEQSYDAMEAYYLAQDIADQHLDRAEKSFETAYYAFAEKNKVTIKENENDELQQKMKTMVSVSKYQRMVYMVFFKSSKQDLYVVDAMNKKDVGALEQNINVLEKFTTEGLAKLDTMKAYKQDRNLVNTAKKSLSFYKAECEKMNVIKKFLLKEDSYSKKMKAFQAKGEKNLSSEEIDDYNKEVAEFNKSVNEYNKTNDELNRERSQVINDWNKSSEAFLNKYVP